MLMSVLFWRAEEAEYIIGMAADWLELDAPDIWVRYDSELVCITFSRTVPLCPCSRPSPTNLTQSIRH